MQPYGPMALRLAVGSVFVAHGGQKLFGLWGGTGPRGTAALFEQMGLAPAYPLALAVGIAELVGGLMLLLGAYTFVASIVLLVDMAVAVWKIHSPHGFFINWGMAPERGHGYEFNVVLAAALFALLLSGAGALSIDRRRARSAESEAAGRARLRAGNV